MENENKTNLPASKTPVQDEDFVFVQQDKSIHDVKFDTKPTTFFKDALKRFAKNKSSVVAAGILAVIIGMAIIVPLADGNDITNVNVDNTTHFLPPKWFDNAGGFLDGTGKVKDAIIDPNTNLPDEAQYVHSAIVCKKGQSIEDAVEIKESRVAGITETILKYGKGGYISVAVAGSEENGIFFPAPTSVSSPSFTFDPALDAAVTYHVPSDYFVEKAGEETSLFATLTLESDALTEAIVLASDIDVATMNDFTVDLSGNADVSSALGTAVSNCRLVLTLSPKTLADASNLFYLEGVSVSGQEGLSPLAFDNAVAEVSRESDKKIPADEKYAYSSGANRSLVEVLAKTGSFRYDYYEAAFGETTMEITEKELEKYIERGFLTWDWSDKSSTSADVWQDADPSMYEIKDLEHSPIREVKRFKYRRISSSIVETETKTLECTVSKYRYAWAKGQLGTCAMPRMIFGTNQNGQDFFKIVFSGLLTSLGLGLLAAIINIFVGLVWGAVSGYFGGITDMVMERVMEILGGMPWIVLMTLIVLLLGSGFWTLLLALCLTGWMGIAGTTRSQFYRFKGREYVLASRTLGASDARLIFKHILPNGIGTIVTGAVLMIPGVIFTEANVAYLLPGVLQYEGGIVSFGLTLSDAQSYLNHYPYLIVSASIVMVLIMIAFNLFGNGLRDALNPSLKGADN